MSHCLKHLLDFDFSSQCVLRLLWDDYCLVFATPWDDYCLVFATLSIKNLYAIFNYKKMLGHFLFTMCMASYI